MTLDTRSRPGTTFREGSGVSAEGTAVGVQRRIRVLHVITHLGHGGATDNTLLSVAGLDRSRYVVDLAAGSGDLEAGARSAADRFFLLPSLRRSLANPGDIFAAAALWRLVGDYDVVHTHTAKAGVLARLIARSRRVPVVVHTIHAFPVNQFMPWWQQRLLLAVERLAAACADRIVAVCAGNGQEALALRIARPDQLRVVVSGVTSTQPQADSKADVRARLGIPPDAPVIGTITRLMEQKAPLDFVAAAHQVLQAVGDAHVILVGDGPMHDAVAAAVGAESRIHVLGFRTDVPDLLEAMDVVVFSSLWEGLGRALTEAVLAAKPVVATAVNGVPDLVEDGVTGYLVPASRPEVLARRVLDVLAQPDLGADMGRAGADRIAGQFDVSEMVTGLDALYREALSRSRRFRRAALR